MSDIRSPEAFCSEFIFVRTLLYGVKGSGAAGCGWLATEFSAFVAAELRVRGRADATNIVASSAMTFMLVGWLGKWDLCSDIVHWTVHLRTMRKWGYSYPCWPSRIVAYPNLFFDVVWNDENFLYCAKIETYDDKVLSITWSSVYALKYNWRPINWAMKWIIIVRHRWGEIKNLLVID